MTKKNYTKNQPENKIKPSEAYPEVIELITDLATFTQKWTVPKIAKTLGMTKQGLQHHIDKKKGKTK